MKRSVKYLWPIAAFFLAASCKSYLDVTPDNVATLDYAFRNRNEAENYLFTCYSTLQQLDQVINDPSFTTSGEIIFPNTLTEATLGNRENEVGFNLIRGTQNQDSPALDYWNGTNLGQPLYQAIRRCNTMLENIDKPTDLPQFEKDRWRAELQFLKAYYHFYLLRMYGPIHLIRENLPITSTTEEVRIKRAPVDACFAYIDSLLDVATPNLPEIIQNQSQEMGRITQTIALSVKAEVLATQASPLFNGNPDYASFMDKDGVSLFPATYDPQKWQKALEACRAAIDLCEKNGAKLYTFIAPGNLPTLPASFRKVMDLRGAITEDWDLNPELIWALNTTFGYQHMSMPRVTNAMVQNLSGAPGNFAVPLSMAELFYTKNGVPMSEDRSFDYRNRYQVETIDGENEKYILATGYQTAKVNRNREPRYYASVSFDGSNYFGNGNTDPEQMYHVQARGATSIAGPKDNIRVNVTGYWPSKLVNYQSVFAAEVTGANYRVPLIRLSGLYLLYAELLNEVSDAPTAEVYRYVDLVRARAGLKGVEESWNGYSVNPSKIHNKAGMRDIIQRERRIELAFEGQAGWDLRRWKTIQTVLSNPVQGWNIQEESPEGYYRPRSLFVPSFGLKDYFWPLTTDDLIINPKLVQNPYW